MPALEITGVKTFKSAELDTVTPVAMDIVDAAAEMEVEPVKLWLPVKKISPRLEVMEIDCPEPTSTLPPPVMVMEPGSV